MSLEIDTCSIKNMEILELKLYNAEKMRIYVKVRTKKKNAHPTSRERLIVMVVNPRGPMVPLLRRSGRP